MFTTEFWVAVFGLFGIGLTSTVRVQIGILYMMEFIPKDYLPHAGTFYFLMEITTALFGVLYFSSLSKNWFGYVFIGYLMQAVGTVMTFFVPESPKYLFKKGLTLQAAAVLQKIARMNGADTTLVSNEVVLESYKSVFLGAGATTNNNL